MSKMWDGPRRRTLSPRQQHQEWQNPSRREPKTSYFSLSSEDLAAKALKEEKCYNYKRGGTLAYQGLQIFELMEHMQCN